MRGQLYPHYPEKGAAGLSTRSDPRLKQRRGLEFGPLRTLLMKLPNGFHVFGSSIVSA